MATVNHNKTNSVAEVTVFGGIDASSPCGDGGIAVDMKNFKVLADGSLCRRSGFSVLRTFGDAVRGAAVFRDGGGTFLLLAVGASVHRISLPNGEEIASEVLQTTEGKVVFFTYDGEIYLVDGAELYHHVGGAEFEVCRGYAPLYGKDWSSTSDTNPVNEPVNLASDKVRFHYLSGTIFRTISFGIKLASIDKVLEGNEERNYGPTLSADGKSVTFSTAFQPTKPVTIYATVHPSYFHDADLRSATGVAHYDAFRGSRVMLYGCGERVFVSRPVKENDLAASRTEWSSSTSLYFPKGGEMALESRQPVTSVGRVGDRVMVLTADEAFISEEMTDVADEVTALPLRSLLGMVGCGSPEGLAIARGDAPITVSRGGIYRWRIDPQLDTVPSVTCISGGIDSLLPKDLFRRARVYYQPEEDLLWLLLPGDSEGRVFLYDCTRECWYSYVGIDAEGLLVADGQAGFYGGGAVSFFDDAAAVDKLPFGEREIIGVYESRVMDLGDGEAVGRLLSLGGVASLGGELAVGLYDGKLLDEVVLAGEGEEASAFLTRLTRRRFKRLAFCLRATGKSPCRILRLHLHTTKERKNI